MIEKILGAGLFIGILIRDVFGFYRFDLGILIFGTSLGILYLFANWWTNKPIETNFRTILVTALYGLTFSCLTLTFVFKLLFLSGSDQMTVLSLISIVVTIAIDFITSINKARVINRRAILRLTILVPIVGLCFFISDDKRIKFTYRQDPDFIKYYELYKDDYSTFFDLHGVYYKNQKTKQTKTVGI
jgi:hypothetical protein